MSIQSFVMLGGTIIALGCSTGCLRLDSEGDAESADGSAEATAQTRRAPPDNKAAGRAASSQRNATQGTSDRGSDRPQLVEATTDECEYVALEAPEIECFDFDPTEPNDDAEPIGLPIAPLCGYVEANISADDDDAFMFATTRSDPVLVELSYRGIGDADLMQRIYTAGGDLVATDSATRNGAGEDLRTVFQATADASYVVRVTDTKDTLCQSYALRVDPLYCSDEYEDNDSMKTPTPLQWSPDERVTLVGAVLDLDEDFFEVTTALADPVHLTGSYTAEPDSSVQVSRQGYDGAGDLLFSVSGDRATETESFSHWLPAPAKGSVLRTRLSASGTGCAHYELTLDAAACTDRFEDNDSATEAAMLVPGIDTAVTIHDSDDDFFSLPGIAPGSCSIAYDIPTGASQNLSLALYDGAGDIVTSDNGGQLSGTVRTLQVSWTTHKVVTVKVTANEGGYCQPYTLRCDATPGQ